MKFTPTSIPEILVIEPNVFGDERGYFMETYQAQRFAEAGITANFVQDNHSRSRQGTLRGLHYQIHQAQGKLLRVISGEIFDVAVDIRRSSPTFKKWVGMRLSADNKRLVWIPKGFAHGFYVLSDWAELIYKTDDFYAPQWERTILWNDADVGIEWPLIKNQSPILSPKDIQGTPFHQADLFD
jgi:dTDP-4-dehydrorhamnose 3,5-epimerase